MQKRKVEKITLYGTRVVYSLNTRVKKRKLVTKEFWGDSHSARAVEFCKALKKSGGAGYLMIQPVTQDTLQ